VIEPARIVRNRRILLIEDQPAVAATLVQLLRIDGHHVDLARDGLEGLERVDAGEYDAILCDVRMPRLDGPGFYAALERTRPALVDRVAFITADPGRQDVREFFAAKRALWLLKPVALAELRQLLGRLAGG
jgi:CheY-like chemotaxis protein